LEIYGANLPRERVEAECSQANYKKCTKEPIPRS
jgi:hypothetical protein